MAPMSAAPAPTVLLTGANRGVGLALAREYAARGWGLVATCRRPAEADDLQALARSNARVRIEPLDVTDTAQIAALARRLEGTAIDVLFNNAAVLGDRRDEGNRMQQLGGLDQALFAHVMMTNVYGPLKLSEALVEHVAASRQRKIVGVTSGLGSLALMGGMSQFYYYQMSKAALNMGMRALRNDLRGRGIVVALLAPGMVQTDLLWESGYRGKALVPDESAAGLYRLVEALTPDDPGAPINVDGRVLPW